MLLVLAIAALGVVASAAILRRSRRTRQTDPVHRHARAVATLRDIVDGPRLAVEPLRPDEPIRNVHMHPGSTSPTRRRRPTKPSRERPVRPDADLLGRPTIASLPTTPGMPHPISE